MYFCFVDEFGDFSASFDDKGKEQSSHESWRPVCGYGGIIIPAGHYLKFCEHFSRLRMIGVKNIAFAKHIATEGSISFEEFNRIFSEDRFRLYSKADEVGGTDFFSGSYLNSSRRSSRRRRSVLRRASIFLSLIEQFDGEIFFAGVDKAGYFARPRNRKRPRSLHVNLVPNVLQIAHQEASARRSQIKLIFDHHHEDDDNTNRVRARSTGQQIHAIAALQTRQEYSQEVIVRNRFYDYLKEPMFFVHSHWSLGIQAADWVCSLLGKVKSFEKDPMRFSSYTKIGEKLGPRIEALKSRHSMIAHSNAVITRLPRQLQLDLGGAPEINGQPLPTQGNLEAPLNDQR
ncbi:DUF3800 domain-containing protein [Bradyrhizobium sp. B124]|uniref:DUF3800 domain-containing protein n=1 Tax=Bradyrhizobium sp. B124 TaxID=3140245 RepID=UPI003183B2CA